MLSDWQEFIQIQLSVCAVSKTHGEGIEQLNNLGREVEVFRITFVQEGVLILNKMMSARLRKR